MQSYRHTYRQIDTDRKASRQTGTQSVRYAHTDQQADTQTHRQTGRQTLKGRHSRAAGGATSVVADHVTSLAPIRS